MGPYPRSLRNGVTKWQSAKVEKGGQKVRQIVFVYICQIFCSSIYNHLTILCDHLSEALSIERANNGVTGRRDGSDTHTVFGVRRKRMALGAARML